MFKAAVVLNPVYVTFFWSVVFLLALQQKNKPGKSLFIFMVTACVLYFSHALYFSGYLLVYSYIDGLYLFCSLSVYPLYYFYVRYLATKSGVKPFHLLHLLFPVIFAVTQYILYIGMDNSERIQYLTTTSIHHPAQSGRFYWLYMNSMYARFAFAIGVVVYVTLTLRLLKKHQQQVEQMFSDEERYGLRWVKKITLFMIFTALTSFGLAIAGREPFARNEHLLLFPSVLISTFLFSIGYIGNVQLRKTELISPIIDREDDSMQSVHAESGLRKKFDEFIASKKPYLNKDLKIWDISREIGSNRTYISRIINEDYGINFNHFVNRYRVEEAKRLMLDDPGDNLNYESIAELSGFGSINSFIRAFKEFEQVTPGKYREMLHTNIKDRHESND